MKWVSIISQKEMLKDGVEEVIYQINKELSENPSLVIAFVSTGYAYQLADFSRILREKFPECLVVGCNASGLIYEQRELQSKYEIAILAASGLSGNLLKAVHIECDNLPSEDDSPAKWRTFFDFQSRVNQNFIVLADPFTRGVEKVLNGLDYAYKGCTVGGFASGELFKGDNIFYLNEQTYNSGLVILDLGREVELVPIVAQGCKAVGMDLEVTKCDNVVLEEVDGQSPLSYLRELTHKLDAKDRVLLQKSLYIGVEIAALKSDLNKVDYLMRNIQGLNVDSGALVVGEHLQVGQRVKFYVRDAEISRQEIEKLTETYVLKLASRRCLAILMFSCIGRGQDFYGEEGVDIKCIHRVSPSAPLAGFFCNGEIAPLAGVTQIHSYTTVGALIFERDK